MVRDNHCDRVTRNNRYDSANAFYLNKTGDSVLIVCVIAELNTVSNNLQPTADY